MTARPLLLDLFCGAGGASAGYVAAGFDVLGVDVEPQPNYPYDFCMADALDFLRDGGAVGFDVIHASPPCQAYSWSARRWQIPRADLVAPTRELLRASGLPYVIENVVGAPLLAPVRLCGTMFGLTVLRHRLFESGVFLWPPASCAHIGTVRGGAYVTVAGHGGDNARGRGSRAVKRAAMGIDWMDDRELNEAIPPAYTEWIGGQLIGAL